MSEQQFPRRIVFNGLGALGAAVALAGCGSDDGDDTTGTPSDPTSKTTDPGDDKTDKGSGGPAPLATTDEIPVGGGIILSDERVVITQPTAGEFVAFSATCTHQGCVVSSVGDGRISCACHGSVYDAATGENIGGPAPAPLAPFEITVKKGEIFAA